MAAISRAIPRMHKQSGRFGVRSISNTGSERDNAWGSFCPTSREPSKDRMPLLSLPNPSSISLHNIPSDVSPRMTVLFKTVPSRNWVPGSANGASIFTSTLGAPHTTGNSLSPVSTLHTVNRWALGWGTISTILPTSTVFRYSYRSVTESTSRPAMVSASARSEASISIETY